MANKRPFKFGDALFIAACVVPSLSFGILGFTWHALGVTIAVMLAFIVGGVVAILTKKP